MKLYVDGVLDYSVTIGYAMTGTVDSIGRDWSGNYFDGTMCDFRVYNVALSDSDIYEIYSDPTVIFPGTVSTSKLFMWHPMTQRTFDKIYDCSGNEKHGTLTNGVTWTGGQTSPVQMAGSCSSKYWFDGSGDYVDVGNASALLNPGKELTVSMWIMPHADALVNTFAMNNTTNNQTTSPWSMKFNNYAHPTFTINTAAGDFGTGEGWSIGHSGWVHLVGTYNSDANSNTGKVDIWENGVRKVSNAPGSGNNGVIRAYPSNEANNMRIGTSTYEGLIDEVCVWDKELTQAEIQSLATTSGWNPGVPKPPDARNIQGDNLLGYWRNSGSGRWEDLSGNGRHGTVNGSSSRLSYPPGPDSGRDAQGFPVVKSFEFDGVHNYTNVGNLGTKANWTVFAWWYKHNRDENNVFDLGDGAGFSVWSTNLQAFYVYKNSSWTHTGTYFPYDTNRWYLTTLSHNDTTNVVKVYNNGVEIDSDNVDDHAYAESFITVKVGDGGYGKWDGKIGNFMIYDRVLSAAEIKHNFNVQRHRFGV